ncbi:MAG: hypothetical protein KatS3mg102_2092 [Planctomycetota bacterium]|nr:MAG: hypothetical protein KatS3mg102_2092 [Planctomycetota bacterium]
MSGPFGGGGDFIRDQYPESYDEYLAKKQGREVSPQDGFVSYDNVHGELTLRLPPELSEHRSELLQDLYEEFYAAPAGDPKVLEQMNRFVADWLKQRTGRELG